MDTQSAVQTLQAIKATIQGNLSGLQSQSEALDVAIAVLLGTLETQAAALEAKYQNTIDDLTSERDLLTDDKNALIGEVDRLQKQGGLPNVNAEAIPS